MNVVCRQIFVFGLVALICPCAQLASYAGEASEAQCACPTDSCVCASCCDSCCSVEGWLSSWPCGCCLADLGEAYKCFKPCCEDSPWVGAGWLAQSFVWNPDSPADRFNGPMTWTDRSNDYQMNELFYYFGKTASTEDCCWDWGFRVDTMYGTNYRWNTSAGFETNWGSNGTFYGIAMPQAYVELANCDWSVKAGRFYSPVGYYVVGTANNFFPVLPYTFQYGEPFTHTGAYATKKHSDSLVLGGGVTHGWDSSDNTGNPHAGALATATWTIDECRSLAYVGVFGNEPNFSEVNLRGNGLGYSNRYLQTLVYQQKICDDILWVLQSDYGRQTHAFARDDDAEWYGLNTYLYWNMTCRCQWGMNVEWFRDDGGFRVGQVLPSFGSPNARGLDTRRGPEEFSRGFDGSFYRFMVGPKYFFTPNIYGRLALAADWYSGKPDANATGALGGGPVIVYNKPFNDGFDNSQEVIVFDLVATF